VRTRGLLIFAVLAAGAASCASSTTPTAAARVHAKPPVRHLAPIPAPAGWHRVAYVSSDRSDVGPRIGDGWTAKTDVRWVLRCETVRGSDRTVLLTVAGTGGQPKSQAFSPNSPGWVRCSHDRVTQASGVATTGQLFRRNPSHDVDMDIDGVYPQLMLNDGGIVFRADAFEQNS
jgi:hypothetical protein